MPRWTTWTILAIGFGAALPPTCMAGAAPPAPARFAISMDQALWKKWGFQYPVTYVFQLGDAAGDVQVRRRDGDAGPWKVLPQEASNGFFNGIECLRLDRQGKRACVSVGFQSSNTIQLEFAGGGAVQFDRVAKYYDDRKAAYTLSLDNWGCNAWAHPGAPWKGPTDDASDCYQAALHVCRAFRLPVSIAINSRSAGGEEWWKIMQEELDRGDRSWEPAVHGQTHPNSAAAYSLRGYEQEILGCRADILARLRKIPYGQRVFEHILTYGYVDDTILRTDSGEFLFVRGFNWLDNPTSTGYVPWNERFGLYGVGGWNTKGYDSMLERRDPKGHFCARDVAELNEGFDRVYASGGIFYALWHPDRFQNSVLYDPSPGEDGVRGSTLMQHLAHLAGRKDVWYAANGWLYSYRCVAERAQVAALPTPQGG